MAASDTTVGSTPSTGRGTSHVDRLTEFSAVPAYNPVIDNAQVTVAADQSLPDLASDVMDEIQDIRDMFERWTGMLSRIRDLSSPEPLDRDLP